jgi:acetyl esterase
MRSVLERRARAKLPPMHHMTAAQARAAYEQVAEFLEIAKPVVARVEDFHIAARDGYAMTARLYDDVAPARTPEGNGVAKLAAPDATSGRPALLFLHGGGFAIGSIATHDTLCRELARLSGCAVVSLDYRLAPEHTFPTAVNDAWDGLQWLHAQGATLGLDLSRVAVGGDSAGGTLAAVCALMARDVGLPLALQLLIYPGTTAHADFPSRTHYREGLLLDETMIDWFFSHYLPREDREDWRFAPLLAPDVEGVAPAWLALAECDPLVDEGLAYADKLRMAGVPVDLEIYRGVVHEFIKMGRVIPEARQFHSDAAAALRRALQP